MLQENYSCLPVYVDLSPGKVWDNSGRNLKVDRDKFVLASLSTHPRSVET
jgi:hypothetical protein